MKNLNPRWLAWCVAENKNPELPFGGCDNNLEYVSWINENLAAFRKLHNIKDSLTDQNHQDFTKYLQSLGGKS